MIASFRKYSTILLISLLMAFLVLAWRFPASAARLSIIILLASVGVASLAVVKKHRQAYLQGCINRFVLMRNILFEIVGLLLAMALAGLLGRAVVNIATQPIDHALTRFLAGILIGLLVGIGVGVLIRRAREHLVRKFSLEKYG